MGDSPDLTWQPSLFDVGAEPSFDPAFGGLQRISLDLRSWVDHLPGWVASPDALFSDITEKAEWGQRRRKLYDKEVVEPRLTAGWRKSSGEPLVPEIIERMRVALSERYGVEFDSVGFNLYRDGRDSVAWHRDRIEKHVEDPIVVLVSLGEPRRFLLRPYGGGPSKAFALGRGDLLVTGGRSQRDWEHAVPKVAKAGPRISLAFRHGLREIAYLSDQEYDDETRHHPSES